MDKSIVAVEGSYKQNDSMASASKSLGSLVQINSIAIDISCAMKETESPPHEHFSIRGFVAGMRRKDRRTCVPSGFNDDVDGAVDSLPPLSVPRFRWWQCSNCVPDIAALKTTLEMPSVDRSGAGTNSCQHIDREKDGMLSKTKQRAGVAPGTRFSGFLDSFPTDRTIICAQRSIEGSKEKTDAKEKDNGGNISYDCDTEAVPLQIVEGHHSDAADEQENASSGSDGPFSVLPHRRKPKLRSLADIMEEEKNSTSELSRMRSTSTETAVDFDHRLNLDVPSDTGKGKKKILEDEPSFPVGAVKKFKGPVILEEKTSKRVENYDSEMEGDFRHIIKTHQMKAKKNKSLETNKKTRQVHVENHNRAIPVRSPDLQKHTTVAETSARNKGNAVTSPEMEPHLLSGKQMARISSQSKSKRPEVVEPGGSFSIPSSKSKLENRNIQREVALDLSLNSYVAAANERNSNNQMAFRHHSGIPDLNESITEKLSMAQGKQLPVFPEKRSLNLQRTLEMPASCSKETAREGKRKTGVSQLHPVQNMVSSVETGRSIDEIEIIELLAKNQHDRALGNSRQQHPSEVFNNSVRVSSPPAVYMDGRTGVVNFPFSNPGNSAGIMARGKMEIGRGMLNFPQAKNRQLDQEEFRLFSSYTPTEQKKTQFPASNAFLSGPRHNEGGDLLWPPRRKNQPFIPNATKSCSIRPNALNMQHSFVGNGGYKGKAISGDEKRTMRDVSAYSNETIPAMQLLSLMDRGIVSGTSSKVGPNSFLEKNLSPCSNHPRLHRNENQTNAFVNASYFSQNNCTKEFPSLLNGICFPGENVKKSYFQGQVPSEPGNSKSILLEASSSSPYNANRSSRAIETLGVCTLNRNPADFSLPDAKEFTITAKDLKLKKRKERSRFVNADDDQKRQKVRKDALRRES